MAFPPRHTTVFRSHLILIKFSYDWIMETGIIFYLLRENVDPFLSYTHFKESKCLSVLKLRVKAWL